MHEKPNTLIPVKKSISNENFFNCIRLIHGLRCKKLFYFSFQDKQNSSFSSRTEFDTKGRIPDIEALFRDKFFPHGINTQNPSGIEAIQKKTPYQGCAEYTEFLITHTDTKNIYEATFIYNNFVAVCDVLHRNNDGSFDIYEVKSHLIPNSFATQLLNLEYFICYKVLGQQLNSFHLVSKDDKNNWRFQRKPSPTSKCLMRLEKRLTQLREEKLLQQEPKAKIGLHCLYPNKCCFFRHCLYKGTANLTKTLLFSKSRNNRGKEYSNNQK